MKAILNAAHAIHFEHQRLDEVEQFLETDASDSPPPPPSDGEGSPGSGSGSGKGGRLLPGLADSQRKPLSADDFLPVFIFVVVQVIAGSLVR